MCPVPYKILHFNRKVISYGANDYKPLAVVWMQTATSLPTINLLFLYQFILPSR